MKKIWKKIKKINDLEIAVALSLVHTVLSHFYSESFFNYDIDSEIAKRNKLLVGILFFLIMSLVYRGIIWLVKNRKQYKLYIKFGVIYFAILMILLLLVWPGVWRHDDMTVAIRAKQYIIDGWQHTLTSLFYMFSFRLIPIYSGVIIVQCAIISIITSYLYTELSNRLKLKRLLPKVLLWIPFILPPVLDNALYPLRPILFSYIIVLLVYLMLKYLGYKTIGRRRLVLIIVLFIIGCTWRSEGLYLLLVAPVYLYYLSKRGKISIRFAAYSFFAILCGFFIISSAQNSTLNSHNQSRYKLSGTVHIAAPLIREAASHDEAEVLVTIDKVIDVSVFIEHPDWSGETVFWSDGAVRSNFTEEEYKAYLKSIIKLALKYPNIAIKNRINNYLITSALRDDFSNTIKDTTNYYIGSNDITDQTFVETGGVIMHQWSPALRNAIIRILEGRNTDDYKDTIPTYPIFWNLIIPFIGIITSSIYFICKKKVAVGIIISSILLKSVIVFATAPGAYHMYYHAEYLLGYILIAFMTIYLWRQHRSGLARKERRK